MNTDKHGSTAPERDHPAGQQALNQHHDDAIMIVMRTTINVPDDVYLAVRSPARRKGLSIGQAVAVAAIDTAKPFPCFVLPEDSEPVTLEETLAAEDGEARLLVHEH